MTPKQKRFVQEYLIDLNATQAAIRAGYSMLSARSRGSRVLNTPEVAEAIARAQGKRAARTGVTADRVVTELAKIAFGNPRRLLALGTRGVELRKDEELSDAEAALVSEITETSTGKSRTRRVKLYCKMTALTALGRHLGLFNGRLEPPAAAGEGGAEANEGDDARERLARRIAELSARLGATDPPGGVEPG